MELLKVSFCLVLLTAVISGSRGDNCFEHTNETCSCCEPGYTGVNCTITCEHCQPINTTAAYCVTGCSDGYYGDSCNTTCPENCIKVDNDTAACRYTDGSCSACRDAKFHGTHCHKKCSPGCINETCQLNGTCTAGCKRGYHGEACDKTCGKNCRNGLCVTHVNFTFNCIDGCKKGYFRVDCKLFCPEGCTDCVQNGSCISCMKEYAESFNKMDGIVRCGPPGLSGTDIVVIVTTVLMISSLPLFFLVRCLMERKKDY